MVKDETNKELTEIDEQSNTHAKLINQYSEDLKSENERIKGIMRNIIISENKIEELKARKKEIVINITKRQA